MADGRYCFLGALACADLSQEIHGNRRWKARRKTLSHKKAQTTQDKVTTAIDTSRCETGVVA
jgi:hypothetical protein